MAGVGLVQAASACGLQTKFDRGRGPERGECNAPITEYRRIWSANAQHSPLQ